MTFAEIATLFYSPIAWLINRFMWFLPDSPFKGFYEGLDASPIANWIGWLNWLVPVKQLALMLSLYTTAVAIYYVVQTVLRWTKTLGE